MNKGTKTLKIFTVVIVFILPLLQTINAEETFSRKNAVVIAVEKVGAAVANLSTEKIPVERRQLPFLCF